MGKYDELAKCIIECVGGRENINALTHCTTKLRFKLEDEAKADTKALKTMQGVITVVQGSGQYQVLIGNHAADVYQAVAEQAGIAGQEENTKRKGFFAGLIDIIADVFAPLMGIYAAMAILKGICNLCLFWGVYQEGSIVFYFLDCLSDAFFYYLPIFLGVTAAKKFQVNQFTGMLIGACFLYPVTLPAPVRFYSVPVVIFAVWLVCPIERFLKKIIPDTVKIFFIPLVMLLVIAPLIYLFQTIIFTEAASAIKITIDWIEKLHPIAAGGLSGGGWQILMILGVYGEASFMMTGFIASCAQAGAVLAVCMKTRDKKLRSISIASVISALFGVPEPGIFGVTLPKKTPFLISCIGAVIGGAAVGYLYLCGYVWGDFAMLGWIKNISSITIDTETLCNIALASFLAFAVTFVAVVFCYREPEEESALFPETVISVEGKKVVYSPLNGKIMPLSEVRDEIFSSGVLGDGIAIEPYEGIVYAPADCKVTTFFPTGHAIGLTTEAGIELLIHIGMDTVQLDGKYFKTLVKQEENLKLGQPILEFDIGKIRQKGYEITTPVIITNIADDRKINSTTEQETTVGDALLWIT